MRKAKLSKKERVRYEMILAWSTARVPFRSQKLSFYAPAKFSLAYKEAVTLKGVLQRAGRFKKSEVKLLAVGVENVMHEYMAENAPYLLKKQTELNEQVKRFLKPEPSDKNKKVGFAAFKRSKKYIEEGRVLNPEKSKPKIVQTGDIKIRVAKPVVPMINAVKPKAKKVRNKNAATN